MKSRFFAAPMRSVKLLFAMAGAFTLLLVGAASASAVTPYPPTGPSSAPQIVSGASSTGSAAVTSTSSGLAFTGAPVLAAGITALVLLVGGIALLILGRRRREV